jgi:hypothetical protein
MLTETRKILRMVEQGVIDTREAFLLFAALQGRPLPVKGTTVRRQDPEANRDFARKLLRQVG